MDKNTLSNYGWIVIAVLVLAVMIALATPFGTYIENGVKSTTAGLFDASEKAMNVVGMSGGEGIFKDEHPSKCCNSPSIVTYGDDSKCDVCGTITYGDEIHGGLIPEGAIYWNCIVPFESFTDCYVCGRLIGGGISCGCDSSEYGFGVDGGHVYEKLDSGNEFPNVKQGDAYQYNGCTYMYEINICNCTASGSTPLTYTTVYEGGNVVGNYTTSIGDPYVFFCYYSYCRLASASPFFDEAENNVWCVAYSENGSGDILNDLRGASVKKIH